MKFRVQLTLACILSGALHAQDPAVAQPGGKLKAAPAVQFVQVADGLVDPIHVTAPKDGTGRLSVNVPAWSAS